MLQRREGSFVYFVHITTPLEKAYIGLLRAFVKELPELSKAELTSHLAILWFKVYQWGRGSAEVNLLRPQAKMNRNIMGRPVGSLASFFFLLRQFFSHVFPAGTVL